MRSYPTNTRAAAGRLLALTMVVDGNFAPSELAFLGKSSILRHVALEREALQALFQVLCEDLLIATPQGLVQRDAALIDHLLMEIDCPHLRRRLLQAMWKIADADDWLADSEAILLARASALWEPETRFSTEPVCRA